MRRISLKTESKKLFFLLEKILNRLDLSEEKLPRLEQWQAFISRINNALYDFDQERYLLERSMEISSHEFVELNERFEIAEAVGKIGHWFYYPNEEKMVWSKGVYNLIGIDPTQAALPFSKIIPYIHEEDRSKVLKFIEEALRKGSVYEIECRLYNQKTEELSWVYIKAHPIPVKDSSDKKYLYNLTGLVMDITEKKNSKEALLERNKMIVLSRQAGMSEIATAVLHNVGNILNSLNVSILIAQELLNTSEAKNFNKAAKMIRENMQENPTILLNDEKIKLILNYLISASESLDVHDKEIAHELKNIEQHADHIKSIVLMQNTLSGIEGVKEKIFLSEICDLAIQMSYSMSDAVKINIKKNYDYQNPVYIDKSRLLQILINLIQNSKDSVKSNHSNEKIITLTTKKSDEKNFIEISVKDNGIGIPKVNLEKIFSMGFTTKPQGHGFGLHSSAITANQLGGSLIVSSEGQGKGAEFILKIPNIDSFGDQYAKT